MQVRKMFFVVLSVLFLSTGIALPQSLPTVTSFIYPLDDMANGYGLLYGDRNFMSIPASNPSLGYHLAVDIDQYGIDAAPVKAVAPGRIAHYSSAPGYGELVVVIEHKLPTEIPFVNGMGVINNDGTSVTTDSILTIYGHLRKYQDRNNPSVQLSWKVNDIVNQGDIIGYINDDANNGQGPEHLHFGIRLSNEAVAKQRDGGKWLRGNDSSDGMYIDFTDPEETLGMFLNAIPGVYANGWHDASTNPDDPSQPILDAFINNGGYNMFGSPVDKGNGYFVYTDPPGGSITSETTILLQDFEDSNGNWWQIALNASKQKGFPVGGQILTLWNTDRSVGPPMSTEYPFDVAGSGSGNYSGGQYGNAGNNLTVQKFSKLSGPIKTLVYNNRTGSLGNFPVGNFHIASPAGAHAYHWDEGTSTWVIWPPNGEVVPTNKWWLDADSHSFKLLDDSGNNLGSFTVTIWEGNNQFADINAPANPAALTNLAVNVVSGSQVDLSWTDPNSPAATPYKVYRDNLEIAQVVTLNFSDNTVSPNNAYTYTVSGNGTPESGSVIINIPNNNSSGGGTDPPQPQPPSFPLTIEAENMDGPPAQVAGGRRLTSQDWYLTIFNQLPQAGWIEAEVIAYTEGQVNRPVAN